MLSTSDLDITLYDLVYDKGLTDEEIMSVLGAHIWKYDQMLKKSIKFVRENPKCPEHNVLLMHKSIEYGIPEHLYCPQCDRKFAPEFPYKELP